MPATPDAVDHQALRFAYRRHADQNAAAPVRHPVVVVGAGPVGLALAVDLAQHGVPVLLLDDDGALASGSRAICFAKRTLEIFDRLGCGQRMVDEGVAWQLGRVFFKDTQVYQFDLLPEAGHQRPAFINLQQYYVEGFLAERALALPPLELRWHNEVVGIEQHADHALLKVETPDGRYTLAAEHVVACDGSRSPLRRALGLEVSGRVFRDRFLIADIEVDAALPAERRFWFDPPFHPGQSVLLHQQAQGMWRADFQLGWNADPQLERQPERVAPRVRALLERIGFAEAPFRVVWASVYTFACQRMASFRHGRVLFAGDAAHGVSPFGARGANSGIQDADNLAWKLAAVLRGEAPRTLLDSYAREREHAADENIAASTRATDFITPKSEASRLFRDAVLALSRRHAFARALVNSGRLSVPARLTESTLNTPDAEPWQGALAPGSVAADAPLASGWLLRALHGQRFNALLFGNDDAATARSAAALAAADAPIAVLRVPLDAAHALTAARYDAQPGSVVLLRPDQHLCARWRAPDAAAIRRAHARALGRSQGASA